MKLKMNMKLVGQMTFTSPLRTRSAAKVTMSEKHQEDEPFELVNMQEKISSRGYSSTHRQQNTQRRKTVNSRFLRQTIQIGEKGDWRKPCSSAT